MLSIDGELLTGQMPDVSVERPENLVWVRRRVADQVPDHERVAFQTVDLWLPHQPTVA